MFSFLTLIESNNLSRRSAGFVECYHADCLIHCCKRLRPPLTLIVGSLETDGDTECHDSGFEGEELGGEFHPPV